MAVLHVYSETRLLGRFTLLEETLWVGRGRDNQIILPGMSVARRHAIFYKQWQQTVLEDKSTKGIQLNGQVIPYGALQHEDLIQIGAYRLVFDALIEDPPVSEAILPSRQVSETADGHPPGWQLVILDGDRSGEVIVLKTGITRIGRSAKNDLVLNDSSVSAFHAEMEWIGDTVTLRDMNSTNGIWINGERQETVILSAEVEVHVGQTGLRLRADSESPHAAVEPVGQKPLLLICGEAGVGKSWTARERHRLEQNGPAPFVELACRHLPVEKGLSALLGHEKGAMFWALSQHRGAIERAAHGTLLLRDIDAMDHPTQAALLEALDQQTFKRCGSADSLPSPFRLIGTTRLPPQSDALRQALLPELYTRMNGCTLTLSPLRERSDDISVLASHFLSKNPLTPAAADKLLAHAWPGNIGELQNVIQRAVIMTAGEALDRGPRTGPQEACGIEADDIVLHPPRQLRP